MFRTFATSVLCRAEFAPFTAVELSPSFIGNLGTWCENIFRPSDEFFLGNNLRADVLSSWLEYSHLDLIDVVDTIEQFQRT